jgi:hypothetical protein
VKALFLASFARDLKKVRDAAVRDKVRSTIFRVEEASDLGAISESGRWRSLADAGSPLMLHVGPLDHATCVRIRGGTPDRAPHSRHRQ